ncbi:MAG: hypothetical protein KJ666_10515 [Bacteroidetes bacterium]|nr:hypothetical protein [Bacteroidota bacterium]MBU2584766.1 hypothetical protein [Bacteroidota bacterium]
MKIEIIYSKGADKFISKNAHLISVEKVDKLIVEAIKNITKEIKTNIDLKYLTGKYDGCFRIRKGKIRIIFKVESGFIIIVTIIDIGFRGNIY